MPLLFAYGKNWFSHDMAQIIWCTKTVLKILKIIVYDPDKYKTI